MSNEKSDVLDFKEYCNKCKREIPEGAMVYRHPELGFVCEYCPEFSDGQIKITENED